MAVSAASGRAGRSLAVARFAIATQFGSWLTRGGILMGAAVLMLGPVLSLRRGGGWSFDSEIGFMGFFVTALFAVRSGLAEQRELDLATFMRHNMVSRLEHAAGLAVGLIGTWIALSAVVFLLVLLASAGDLLTAAWSTSTWGLRLLVILGFVPLVEAVSSLRVPLIVPAFAYMGLLIALTIAMPEDQAIALFIPVERGDTAALARLGAFGLTSFSFVTLLFIGLSAGGARVRNGFLALVRNRP